MHQVRVRIARQKSEHEIVIGPGLLGGLGELARRSLSSSTQRVVVISNPTVFDLYGDAAMRSLRKTGFKVSFWLMPDGERFKTLRSLDNALASLHQAKLGRDDALVALGGGVVGDLAGFAAAVYMRGISYIHAPTTLLAQVDASIGGKTAVNSAFGKNVIGAFHQPRLVIIDPVALRTLPSREMTSGWLECIKNGAVGSRTLFDQTVRYLAEGCAAEKDAYADELSNLIAAHCAFKAGIVSGDEREKVDREDYRSRRILNFGHTTAHALEFVTKYRRFRHGEAVGYGMLVAGDVSKRLGILDVSELESLRTAIHLAGKLPRANNIEVNAIMSALMHDKKNVGGHIKWILLERLGRARIVDGHDVGRRMLRASINDALQSVT